MNSKIILLSCFVLLFCGLIVWYIRKKREQTFLKQHGIKVIGTVVDLTELTGDLRSHYYHQPDEDYLFNPMVAFTTVEGKKVRGKPIIGFVGRATMSANFDVYVYYNPKNPKKFLIVV